MNNNVWRWFLLSACCLFPLCGFAQNVGSVRGVVTDQGNSSPMEYVTVRVLEQPGNKLVKGTITDVSGAFRITGLAAGNYRLLLTYTGYDSLSKDFTVTAAAPDVRLRQMQMRPLSKQLKGVNVVTQQSQMTLEVDKKVFNVGQDLTKSGSSASELLETIPSVEVDNEGGISLRGNTNVTIWIDGKPSGLTADNQGQILEQMPAENIDRIEVITNPSAKYSPEGTTGI
ncbi:MAG: TonB-dependent receptor, partial [Bacteroidales bacterium]|nr:TonB-dependent receptor [Bacteroidales bacterium]